MMHMLHLPRRRSLPTVNLQPSIAPYSDLLTFTDQVAVNPFLTHPTLPVPLANIRLLLVPLVILLLSSILPKDRLSTPWLRKPPSTCTKYPQLPLQPFPQPQVLQLLIAAVFLSQSLRTP